MPNFNLPHTFHDGTGETASGVQLDEDLQTLKEKIEAVENNPLSYLLSHELIRTVTSEPTIGVTLATSYTETGINFPTACQVAFLAGWQAFSDAGHTTSGATFFTAAAVPLGKNVQLTVTNQSGGTLYPRIYVVAFGH